MKVFEYLPTELIDIILEFEGSIKQRNGVYMNQISRSDERYKFLDKLHINSLNNLEIMKDLDNLKAYMNLERNHEVVLNEDDYDEIDEYIIEELDEIHYKFSYLFTLMSGLNYEFDDLYMLLVIDNVSNIWSGLELE